MNETQYDMLLVLMDDYELARHKRFIESAARLERHHGLGAGEYEQELAQIDLELTRRAEEKTAPF